MGRVLLKHALEHMRLLFVVIDDQDANRVHTLLLLVRHPLGHKALPAGSPDCVAAEGPDSPVSFDALLTIVAKHEKMSVRPAFRCNKQVLNCTLLRPFAAQRR